ncbi:MAG: neutral/alkaline non-lysosomal ceramidase N-terminal domain-containing protein [Acidobacteria bacterium]|nr:neutral/alkaline non-lysosomal ceramidase N-terminal domain-containing protein [Acidobacteriota bacterium]
MKRLFSLIAVLWLAAPAAGAPLRAGVAKVDITPPTGLAMWGYAARKTPSTGTLDPLYARVLVLEAGEKRLALVVLDLGRTFGPAALQGLREKARKSSGISYTLVQATHTHAGPVIRDEYPSGNAPAWETAALEKIAGAIQEASQKLIEVQLGTGYGEAFIGYNRIRVNPDGTVTMLWRNETRVATSPLDPRVSVIRIDTTDGKPLSILVNHACHPVVFGWLNLEYSADFPGVTVETVEEAFGGEPLVFFLQGAPGDINPYFATTPPEKDPIARRDWTGQKLGEDRHHGAHRQTDRADGDARRAVRRVPDELARALPGARRVLSRLRQRVLRILSHHPRRRHRRLRRGQRYHLG